MLQGLVHYSMHFLVIGLIAYGYDRNKWLKYWGILLATMLVDLDHLLATPIFDPERCGIGFHPLHSEIAIGIYCLGSFFIKHKVLRLICIGLLFHMLTDSLDCLWTNYQCNSCMFPNLF